MVIKRGFLLIVKLFDTLRNIRNGLPRGSVLAPTLLNMYTNDHPMSSDNNIKHYVYADDSATAVQEDTL